MLSDDSWKQIQTSLRFEFGSSVYGTWLCHLSLHAIQGTQVILSVPNESLANFIETQYSGRILKIVQDEFSMVESLDIVVSLETQNKSGQSYRPVITESPLFQPVANGENQETALFKSMPIDRRFTFESYVTGLFNQMAFRASQGIVSDDSVVYNPLYIFGGVGMGKTHLLHAIAGGIEASQPYKNVMLLSAEKFTYEFVKAIRSNNGMAFKDIFASVDVLLIDDIQFIAGKESTQAEFMNTVSNLMTMGKQVVLCADKAPLDLVGLNSRDQSRLGAGIVVEIKSTDYQMRRLVLGHKIQNVGVVVPDDVLDYLAEHVTSSIRELEASLNRLVAYANIMKVSISLELVEECLQDILRNSQRKVTLEDIQMACSKYFEVSMADLHSARRSRHVARPRQVAMYLAKTMTNCSLPAIGRSFGGRDHTTVMHAVKRIEELCDIDTSMDNDVKKVRQSLIG